MNPNTAREKTSEYLSFRLGEQTYAIDILTVQEIRPYEAPTRLANTPDFVQGVLNLRGRMVPIIDLRVKLACDATCTAMTVMVFLQVQGVGLGVVVDSVVEVVKLTPSAIQPVPQFQGSVDSSYVIGMAGVEGRMLAILDIAAWMASQEIGLIVTAVPS